MITVIVKQSCSGCGKEMELMCRVEVANNPIYCSQQCHDKNSTHCHKQINATYPDNL